MSHALHKKIFGRIKYLLTNWVFQLLESRPQLLTHSLHFVQCGNYIDYFESTILLMQKYDPQFSKLSLYDA